MTDADRAFLDAIVARPADDLPRLAYADYLDERGDPRGEFVRAQCLLARLPRDHPDRPELETVERQLLWTHEHDWLAGLDSFISGATFRRGFLEDVVVMTDAFLRDGLAIFAEHPVRKVKFRGARGYGAALAKVTELERLEAVDLGYVELEVDDLTALLQSRRLLGLRELSLAGNHLGDTAAQAVAAQAWTRLEALDLEITRLTPVGLRALGRSPALAGLKEIGLAENPLGDAGAMALAAAAFLPNLAHLDLTATAIGDAGVASLADAPAMAAVRDLRLSYNRLGDAAAQAVAASPHLLNLRRLDLNANAIRDAGVRSLLASPLARTLDLLTISLNPLGDDVLRELDDAMPGRWG